MAAVVGDLDECALVVGFDDGAGRAGGPAPGRRQELDHLENSVSRLGHRLESVAPGHGIEVLRFGGGSEARSCLVEGELRRLRPLRRREATAALQPGDTSPVLTAFPTSLLQPTTILTRGDTRATVKGFYRMQGLNRIR
ncbi:MAG: hypothetical protein M3401_04525 [Actinomycetota bacterium]|nr:hypothetical protein [Actinomycetota bacterium]